MRQFLAALRERQQSWILFTFLQRPRDVRDAISKFLVIAAVVAAAVTPVFIGRGGGDLTAGAGAAFNARLAELAELREERDAAEDAGRDVSELEQRIAELESETTLGYLPRDGDAAQPGGLIPDFRLLDLDGEPVRLSEIEGPIILNFWASWCQPCVEEMPDFEIVHQELGDRITLIGVNDGESLATARQFADIEIGVSYVILIDPTKQLTDGPYLLVGRPTTYYIDATGEIREIRVGFHTLEEMRSLAGALLDEDLSESAEPAEASGDYADSALNLLDSARANYAVGADLLERWQSDASVFSDPGWQRSMSANVRTWADLVDQFEALAPPEDRAALHEAVKNGLTAVHVAGQLVADAIEGPNEALLSTASGLFQNGREQFDAAADDLEDVLSGR